MAREPSSPEAAARADSGAALRPDTQVRAGADFEELLRPVMGSAYGAALRMTGNRHDAEDLVQDAALRAFRAFHSFQPGTNFRAWFYRILVNRFLSTRRSTRNVASLDELENSGALFLYERTMEAGLHAGASDPARALLDRMTADDVARALSTLPDEFRAVATLYFFEDLSYQEIADMLEVPVGTVRSRLHRARRMLQKELWRIAEDHGIVAAAQKEHAGGGE